MAIYRWFDEYKRNFEKIHPIAKNWTFKSPAFCGSVVRKSRSYGAADFRRGHATKLLGFDEAIDLVPTFVEAAGVPVADHIIEGKSFLDRLRGGGAARDDVYCELDYAYYRARLELGVDPHEARSFMIRTERWKYINHLRFRPQLFDLENDPKEFTDLGADAAHEAVRRDMQERLFQRMARRKERVAHSTEAVEKRTDGSRNVGVIIGEW